MYFESVAAAPVTAQEGVAGARYVLSGPTAGDRLGPYDCAEARYAVRTSEGRLMEGRLDGEACKVAIASRFFGLVPILRLVPKGGRVRVWADAEATYGPAARPRALGPIIVDFELIRILKLPAYPSDVDETLRRSYETSGGVRHAVLSSGEGPERARPTSWVEIAYTSWMMDGVAFHSTRHTGPEIVKIDEAIPGWREELTLMARGEHRRLWVPAELAYGDVPAFEGAPAGPILFDIGLLRISRSG